MLQPRAITKHKFAREPGRRRDSTIAHRHDQLRAQQVDDPFDSFLPVRSQAPHIGPADANRPRSERQRLEDVRAAPESTINKDWDPASDCVDHFRQDIDCPATCLGGAPAVEFKFTGLADEHEWSGTLVVVGRGRDVLTILGMTYADTDLIQIQENVIARAISSTDFNVQ